MAIGVGFTISASGDKYEIKEEMKSGGFGTTFLAIKNGGPEKVVIKVPQAFVLKHPTWSKKFEREARILANLKHRNIVKIIAFWTFADGDMALVQELITDAKTLDEYVREHPDSVASLFLQACHALHAFHAVAKPAAIHRDLSPPNMLVDGSGRLRVIDFGLAKEDPRVTETLTLAGHIFGTPGCISPEQATDAANVDHRTDLYALGRSFAAALQKRKPMHADPMQLPEPWRELCVKLTAHDPDQRYGSAAEVRDEAMGLFADHGTPVHDFAEHVKQMKDEPGRPGWAALCESHYISRDAVEVRHFRSLSRITMDTYALFAAPNQFFDLLEESAAVKVYESGRADFDDVDYLGEVYRRIYPALDTSTKLKCFARVVDAALRYTRYSVMGDVRSIIVNETDPAMRKKLLATVDEADPGGTIRRPLPLSLPERSAGRSLFRLCHGPSLRVSPPGRFTHVPRRPRHRSRLL